MKTRLYKQSDLEAVLKLFYDNIHTVCVNDYTLEQLDAWAPKEPDVYRWQASLNRNHTLVVENESQIIGFGDVGETGYLDRLYVHPDYLHQGIASLIVEQLEKILSDRELYIQLAHGAIQMAKKYDCQHMVASIEKILNE